MIFFCKKKSILKKRLVLESGRKEGTNKEWSIELLAEYMDISPSFLASVERGERALSLEKLYKASIILGVTTDYLMKDSFPTNSRNESLNLLVSDLNDNEYRAVYEIIQSVKKHLRDFIPYKLDFYILLSSNADLFVKYAVSQNLRAYYLSR